MSSMMGWRRMCAGKQIIGAGHLGCMVRDAKDAKPDEIQLRGEAKPRSSAKIGFDLEIWDTSNSLPSLIKWLMAYGLYVDADVHRRSIEGTMGYLHTK
ncbi:unnamed protein product [Toxocara canis]|uniref:Archease domain-containing protein n=1 Tax=Toxocara canis TaxID=6265 RepID=A0A183TX32_TOXCA|nr:unnamed protein product [Toxocara canis]